MSRPTARLRRLALCSATAAACVLALATAASAEPGFGASATIPLPAGSSSLPASFAYEGLACPSATSCVAVGPEEVLSTSVSAAAPGRAAEPTTARERLETLRRDLAATYGLQPLRRPPSRASGAAAVPHAADTLSLDASVETSGTWAAPTPIALPPAAVTTGELGPALFHVACTAVGDCVAVGEYPTATVAASAPLVATETGGTWSTADGVLPSNAVSSNKQNDALVGVTCLSTSNCVAAGHYTGTDGLAHADVAVETAGSWAATQLPDPTGLTSADVLGAGPIVCTDLTDCQVLGILESTTSQSVTSYVWTETAGSWSTPVAIAPKAHTLFVASDFACPEATTCLAVGEQDSDIALPAYATETSGVWGAVTALPLPQLSPLPLEGALSVLACAGGTCEAGGIFLGLSRTFFGIVAGAATWTGGAWSSIGLLQHLAVPKDAFLSSSEPSDLVCPPSGACVTLVDSSWLDQNFNESDLDVSVPLTAVRPVIAPRAPAAVLYEGIPNGVEAAWLPPTDDGGAPVLTYTVTIEPSGRTCTTATDGCAFHGLVNGHRYRLLVTDRTSFGTSPRAVMGGFAIAGTPPSAPRGLRLREVDGRLVASWHASAALRGEPVEHYDLIVISRSGYHRRLGTKGLMCTLRVSAPGAYLAQVDAVNASGDSKPSNVATATYRRPRHR